MKSIGFMLMKCYQAINNPHYLIGVKPLEIVIFEKKL